MQKVKTVSMLDVLKLDFNNVLHIGAAEIGKEAYFVQIQQPIGNIRSLNYNFVLRDPKYTTVLITSTKILLDSNHVMQTLDAVLRLRKEHVNILYYYNSEDVSHETLRSLLP